ncbi:DUF4174 domain-containing protein [Salipiger bermudensis]|uniref:DUF4174 domain-containing protein n=1 Tax=Salipiger bermudensis (strain DSM 26914 / JCM 13377 / KCTC 12554 / HTCC2601) TaxID=314265 RepID=Q0FMB3_SALBH|nr:DUF4174 domain-containing protein [Salipiger bermudensis]EAU45346.1 hypothetical protein R2601_24859 [Salipiger bermudensis HTCC2601]
MGRIRMKTKLGVAVIAGAIAATQAVGAPDLFQSLPADARDLDGMRWDKRPVLLFAPSKDHPDYARQIEMLREAQAALAERDIVVLSDLDDRTPSPLRQGFQPGGFKLVLVGKDGGVKLEQDAVLAPEELFAVIDRMPMRRNEMRD